MVKNFKTSAFLVGGDTGLITHEDQEVNGLSFNVLFDYENEKYVEVTGEEANITAWATRVSGVEVTQETVDTIAATFPPAEEPVL